MRDEEKKQEFDSYPDHFFKKKQKNFRVSKGFATKSRSAVTT